MTPDVHRTVEAVWRMESARVVAALTRLVGDVGQAEDLAQDALVAALERWPETGVPERPGAWLMGAAKHRAIDVLRHRAMRDRKEPEVAHELQSALALAEPDLDARIDDPVGDDLLRLVFTTCHPLLADEAAVALTLRVLGGLTTQEIARAFLVPVPTVAQRIVRAKRTLSEAQVPFEVPRAEELPDRLGAVLKVIYLIFNEGYAATEGESWTRPALCEEALRLGRVVAGLMPVEPEVHGLVALMEIQASRLRARIGSDGRALPLDRQDRARWDRVLIGRGLAALEQARALGGAPGPYVLQAEIVACHARAATLEETDWVRIAALYQALAVILPSPVVELNRAVALGMAFGPETGLEAVDRLRDEPALAAYHLLPAVRADLLKKLGRTDEARAELERAIALTRNEHERDLMRERVRQL